MSPPSRSTPAPSFRPEAAALVLVGTCFGRGPGGRPAHLRPAFLSLSCHSSARAPWPPRHTALAPKAAPFRSRDGLPTKPTALGEGPAWGGLTQRGRPDLGGGLTWEVCCGLQGGPDLIGGHTPKVQVGVAGGGVQPILGHIAVHVFRGSL